MILISPDDLHQPFTEGFPRADVNQILSPDILHQLIKGGFHDHLVTWVNEYLELRHGMAKSKEIQDDIARRYVIKVDVWCE